MTDADKILERLDAIDKRLDAYDRLIVHLGCATPENMEADKINRDVAKGIMAIGRFSVILAAVGRFVLMFAGMITAAAAILSHWKGAP